MQTVTVAVLLSTVRLHEDVALAARTSC